MALEKLGQSDRSKALFQQLIDTGTQKLNGVHTAEPPTNSKSSGDQTQVADAYYLVGLGQLGLNNPNSAKQEFSRALEASPDHFAARMALMEMRP
jgi:Tfp pilus assembly protein PilF